MKVYVLANFFLTLGIGCSNPGDRQTEEVGSIHVKLETGEPPALIAFRDDSSTQWQTVPITGLSTFEFALTGTYRVVIACDSPDSGILVGEYARTPVDDPAIEHPCRSYPFLARGEVKQPGAVSLGNWRARSFASAWTFELPVATGSFDLVALSLDVFSFTFDQIVIRRGITVTGDTQLGSIDFGQEITRPLVPTQFTPLNFRPGELTFGETRLYVGNTISTIDDLFLYNKPAWDLKVVPNSLLQTADRQVVSLWTLTETPKGAITQTHYRNVSREFRDGDPASVMLPQPLESVGFELSADRLIATWDSLPEHDELSLDRTSFAPDGSPAIIHTAVLSAAYVAMLGVPTAALDFSDIPGFKSEWRHDPTLQQLMGLFAERTSSGSNSTSSGVAELINAGPPRPYEEASLEVDFSEPVKRVGGLARLPRRGAYWLHSGM